MHGCRAFMTCLILAGTPAAAHAQGTQRFASLDDAMQAGGALGGKAAPPG